MSSRFILLSHVFPLISPLLFVLVLLSRAHRLHETTTSDCVTLVERWRHFLTQSCMHTLLSLSHRHISPPRFPPQFASLSLHSSLARSPLCFDDSVHTTSPPPQPQFNRLASRVDKCIQAHNDVSRSDVVDWSQPSVK